MSTTEINVNVFEEAVKAEPILQFFKWEHLPEKSQEVSRPFWIACNENLFRTSEKSGKNSCFEKTS